MFAVDGFFHPLDRVEFVRLGFAPKEADLPGLGLGRGAQTFAAQRTWQAVALRTLKLRRYKAVVDAVRSVLVERLSGGASTGAQAASS